jgi:hypothetical protein
MNYKTPVQQKLLTFHVQIVVFVKDSLRSAKKFAQFLDFVTSFIK